MKKFLVVLLLLASLICTLSVMKYNKRNRVVFKKMNAVIVDEKITDRVRVLKGDKWGLTDDKGKLIGKLEYDYVSEFNNGLAIVVKNNKYGYVDKKFKFVVEPKYRYADGFVNNYAIVYGDNGKVGIVNIKGKETVKPDYYDYISSIDSSLQAIAKNYADKKEVVIDVYGKIIKDLSKKK